MEYKTNPWLIVAGIAGFLAVALGAFGAHLLKAIVSSQALDWWHTGVEYHLVHAVALLVLSLSPGKSKARTVALVAFSVGIALFSGSLYALTVTGWTGFGAVAPVGGVAFLTGWVSVVAGARRPRAG